MTLHNVSNTWSVVEMHPQYSILSMASSVWHPQYGILSTASSVQHPQYSILLLCWTTSRRHVCADTTWDMRHKSLGNNSDHLAIWLHQLYDKILGANSDKEAMIRYTRLYDKILWANSDKEAMRVRCATKFWLSSASQKLASGSSPPPSWSPHTCCSAISHRQTGAVSAVPHTGAHCKGA